MNRPHPPTTTVLVADDQALVRAGFAALLDHEPDLDVVGQADDGAAALSLVRVTRPDVVVMDIRMPLLDGIAATQAIRSDPTLSSTRVLVLTTFDQDDYVVDALRAGASGFLLKGVEPAELIKAVRIVARGDALLAPEATRRLIEQFVAHEPTRPDQQMVPGRPRVEVTARELEVWRLLAEGLSNAEIASRLHISTLTTKSHVSSLLLKNDLKTRVQLVVRAFECGLVGVLRARS